MFTFQQEIEISADRRIVIELPPETPLGPAKIEVTIASPDTSGKKFRQSLSEYFKANGEDWGDAIKSTDVEGFTGRSF